MLKIISFLAFIFFSEVQSQTQQTHPSRPLSSTPPLAILPDGTRLKGTFQKLSDSEVVAYKGIRYAQPPIDDLRWKSPVGPYVYNETKPVDCTAFREMCVQDKGGSEDCLFLNVFVNKAQVESSNPSHDKGTALLPVAVFIHGGSFIEGAAKNYDGFNPVDYWEGKAVFVTLDYRVNVFGFLGAEALRGTSNGRSGAGDQSTSTGNWGIQDQRMALQWIQDNIEKAFGGDPQAVTIIGQSAGGGSVSNHLVMKSSWPYFSSAIIESGSFPHWIAQSMSRAENTYTNLLSELQCTDTEDTNQQSSTECLRSKSTKEVYEAAQRVPTVDPHHYLSPYAPVVDGIELQTHPFLAVSQGQVADVPLMHGSNRDEGILFVSPLERSATEEDLLSYWSEEKHYTASQVETLRDIYLTQEYPDGMMTSSYWWAGQRSVGDELFSCPAQYLSQQLQSQQYRHRQSSTYMYFFGFPSFDLGTTIHTAEIPYVFHWKLGEMASTDLSNVMSSYWGNSILDMDPNSQSVGIQSDVFFPWPEYSAKGDEVLVFDSATNIFVTSDLKKQECDFLLPIIEASIREDFA